MMDLKYHHNYFNYCNSFYFYSLNWVGKGIHGIPETLTGYGMCNTESGIRKNFGTGSRIAEENGIRDSIDRCSGFGMVVKRSGNAGSGTRFSSLWQFNMQTKRLPPLKTGNSIHYS